MLLAIAGHPSKEAAKEAKRGLYVLKARGVDVPAAPLTPALPAPPPALPEPPPRAYASAIDGHGERALWLPRVLAGKGVEIAQAVLSDERGLLELQLGVVGPKGVARLRPRPVERGAAMGVGEIDLRLALAMIAAARATATSAPASASRAGPTTGWADGEGLPRRLPGRPASPLRTPWSRPRGDGV